MNAMLMNSLAAGCSVIAAGLAFVAWRRASADTAERAADPDAEIGRGPLRALVSPIAAALRPSNQTELDELKTMLLHAGKRSRDAVDRYLEDKVLFLLLGLASAVFAAFSIGGLFGMLVADLGLVVGLLGPKKWLQIQAAERREAIQQTLPAAVDLLTTCVEAGLSLEQAVTRVARDLELAAPILAEELRTTGSELEAGVAMPDALRRLSRRVGLDDLSALCGVIAQAHGLGAPIGQTLREYADSSRRQRMSVLEERAGKIAAQLTLPLAACFLPAALLVMLGPAAVQLVRALH